MTMEKKAWVEPKVEAVEFQANEYVTACYTAQTVIKGSETSLGGFKVGPMTDIYYVVGDERKSINTWDLKAITNGDANIFSGNTDYNNGHLVDVVGMQNEFGDEDHDLTGKGWQLFFSDVDPSVVFLSVNGFEHTPIIGTQAVFS